jgi:pheromone shutdown protein TraB
MAISKNAAIIRDFIKEIKPEEIVLEMCPERFDAEMRDILNHPNFDKTMGKV